MITERGKLHNKNKTIANKLEYGDDRVIKNKIIPDWTYQCLDMIVDNLGNYIFTIVL